MISSYRGNSADRLNFYRFAGKLDNPLISLVGKRTAFWGNSRRVDGIHFIVRWKVCDNSIRPRPVDWSKAPGLFFQSMSTQAAFCLWGVMGSQTRDFWRIGILLSLFERIKAVEFICFIWRCVLYKSVRPVWIMSGRFTRGVNRTDGRSWWNSNRGLKAETKTPDPFASEPLEFPVLLQVFDFN